MRLEYFQMLDRVAAIDLGEREVRALGVVPTESPIFEGHFPSYPLMPGVLLTECMAQTVGWLVSALVGFTAMPILVGIREAKFRALVLPGDALEFQGKVVHEGSGFSVGDCKGLRAGRGVCEARLTYRLIPYPTPEFRRAVREWAERLDVPVETFAKESIEELRK
jgi:3-hydroxyacyl-[acyl-carrier-protein] dehydratase